MCKQLRLPFCVSLLFLLSFIALAQDDSVAIGDSTSGILAPVNPEYLEYFKNANTIDAEVPRLRPSHIDFDSIAFIPDVVLNVPEQTGVSFPSYYDLRDYNRVTSVKEQLGGTCWAYATYGSLESLLCPQENRDFSEMHMVYYDGFDGGSSGHQYMSTAYLTRWDGPVNDNEYTWGSDATPCIQKHVQEVLYLPKRENSLDNDWIKWAVTNSGGVYTTIYYDGNVDDVNDSYYTEDMPKCANHGVVIVGWDDNFDRSRFLPRENGIPAGDGAFIVKNSHGETFCENGYFYVSYYDAYVGQSNSVFIAEPVDNYDNIYQYDPLGRVDIFYATSDATGQTTNTRGANVFKALKDENLSAVSFYTTYAQTTRCRVDIYLDPIDGPINPNGPAQTTWKSINIPGYHTVKLTKKLRITEGQKFSVVVSFFTNGDDLWSNPIAIERKFEYYSSSADALPGQSYVSSDGVNWLDLTTQSAMDYDTQEMVLLDSANVCIKAFTDNSNGYMIDAHVDWENLKVVWNITNNTREPAWFMAYAKQNFARRTLGGLFDRNFIIAKNYTTSGGDTRRAYSGWVYVPAGETVTATSNTGVKLNTLSLDVNSFIFSNGKITINRDLLKHLDLTKNYLKIDYTEPASNAVVPPHAVVIAVFDRQIKKGPQFSGIQLMSAYENKTIFPSISGNILYLNPQGLLVSEELGDNKWLVTIPKDAVTDEKGNGLESDYTWTFTTTIVN